MPPRYKIVFALYAVVALFFVLLPQPPLVTPSAADLADSLPFAWVADGLRNVVLFIPLGAAIAWPSKSTRIAVIAGFAVSASIEILQLVIPGRFPSCFDVMTNGFGAWIGAVACSAATHLIRPTTAYALRLSLAASVASIGVIATGACLLQPVFPSSTYYGGWTADLGHLARYGGQVVEARVGAQPISRAGPVKDGRAMREALIRNEPIVIHAISGPAPPSLAPLVTIHDDQQREILLVGIDGRDLVFSRLLRAFGFGLENPSLRYRGALSQLDVGQHFSLRLDWTAAVLHLQLNDRTLSPAGWSAARSWGLLIGQHPALSHSVARGLDFLWLVLLTFPASYWARRRILAWLGVSAFGLVVLGLPRLGLGAVFTEIDWLAIAIGIAAGICCSRRPGDGPKSPARPDSSSSAAAPESA